MGDFRCSFFAGGIDPRNKGSLMKMESSLLEAIRYLKKLDGKNSTKMLMLRLPIILPHQNPMEYTLYILLCCSKILLRITGFNL